MRLMIAVLALFALEAHAADPHFYLGFTGVQTQDTTNGKYRYADVQIGSDEDTSTAAGWNLWLTLTVQKDGATVCQSSIETVARVRPSFRPLRFQVFYPKPTIYSPLPSRIGTVTYKLYSKLEVREPGTSRLITTTTNNIDYAFSANGTPSCLRN